MEGGVLEGKDFESGCYVKPCIAEVTNEMAIVQHETFAPILYLMKYKTIRRSHRISERCAAGLIQRHIYIEFA